MTNNLKQMVKRVLVSFLLFVVAICCCGCSNKETEKNDVSSSMSTVIAGYDLPMQFLSSNADEIAGDTICEACESSSVDEYYCKYAVKPGDTYYKITQNYCITMNQLWAFNGLDPEEVLQAGWVLCIPNDSYVPPEQWEYTYVPVWDESVFGESEADEELWEEENVEVLEDPEMFVWAGDDADANYEVSVSCDGAVWANSVTLYSSNTAYSSWYNIKRAAEKLNGYVLKPGQEFNWFTDMGPCSYDDGFIDGGAYVPGGTAPGGGICMVSTALMQAARGSGCVITECYDHSKPVSYATPGNEATVSYGSANLRFVNPSSNMVLRFWVTADEGAHSLTVSTETF